MKSTNVEHGIMLAANSRLWGAIGNMAGDVASRINTNPAFLAKIARFVLRSCYEPTCFEKSARKIMGKNYVGVEEAIQYFGVEPTEQQLDYLNEFRSPTGRIITDDEMRARRNTHILVADFGLPILDIIDIVDQAQHSITFQFQNEHGKQEPFVQNKGEVGWHLVRKEPNMKQGSKTWGVQLAHLSKLEEVPTARIMVYSMIGHFLATGEHTTSEMFVRCADVTFPGVHVNVSSFNGMGFLFEERYDDYKSGMLSIASMFKS